MVKVNIKFIILTILAFVFAYLFGGNLPYRVFYAFLLIIIFSLFYVFNRLKDFDAEVEFDKKNYVRGEKAEVIMNMYNDGFVANYCTFVKNINLQNFDPKYNGDLFTIQTYNYARVKKEIVLNRRGSYDFGEVEAVVNDLFFFISLKKILKKNYEIRVYPKIHSISSEILIKNDVFKKFVNSKNGRENLYTVRDVRKYTDGDNPKKIHWKISARYGELYVRNVDNVIGQQCDIMLDMSLVDSDDSIELLEDRGIDLLCSMVNYMMLKGVKSRIFINNLKMKNFNVTNVSEFKELIEYFVNNESKGERLFSNFIGTNLPEISSSNFIGIICRKLTSNIMDAILAMQSSGKEIYVFYGFQEEDTNYSSKLQKVGINALNIGEAEKLLYKIGE